MSTAGERVKTLHVHEPGHAQLCLTLRDPTDSNPPGSSVHGTLQASTLEWVAISFPGGPSRPRGKLRLCASCAGGGFFTSELPGSP